MGALSDAAKKNSPFLIIAKGETVLVRYEGFRLIPNKQDPNKETAQYIVNCDGSKKFWENGSSKIMQQMDQIKEGTYIRISRNKWINQDKTEDASKSSYLVQECDAEGKPIEPVAWNE